MSRRFAMIRRGSAALLCAAALALPGCDHPPRGFLGLTWGEDAGGGARRLGLVLDRWYPTSAPTFETAMDVHPRPVLGVDGRVALVRDAERRLVGVHIYHDDCPRDGGRLRLRAARAPRALLRAAQGPLYAKWRDGSLVHLEARREGTCTLTVAGPAFGPGFAAVLLRRGLGDVGAAMTAH